MSGEEVPAALCCFQTSFRFLVVPAYRSLQSVTTARTATFLHCTDSSGQDFVVRLFTVSIFLRLTVKIISFLRLTAKFLAVLRLTVNPIETFSKELSNQNDIIIALLFAGNKNKDNVKVALASSYS